YALRAKKVPAEHVVVFDEAQRAWDADYVSYKHGDGVPGLSEPELLLKACERIPGWCLVVALVGDGQEIHRGEEAGLGQWGEAIERCRDPWRVHGPARLEGLFPGARATYEPDPLLDLTLSLRSHRATDLAIWVGLLLQGKLEAARALAESVTSPDGGGFELYVTRDLGDAKRHIRDRYDGQPARRYGIVASSKAKNLERHGIRNGYLDTRRVKVGPWFEAAPDDALSGCRLDTVVTEFGCQGLELDFALLPWGDDFAWVESGWKSVGPPSRGVRDPQRLRTNAYRVLLTRGRDGLCIFVPPEPRDRTDPTYDALLRAGVRELPVLPVAGA
ncbi:MAG TPA: DNA/RNA helicase domain-containing protein, partial [Planctomycetota bacterium]|nr:DNA/RNA helicase domain-containing protein [Planctomycetota bacterium]